MVRIQRYARSPRYVVADAGEIFGYYPESQIHILMSPESFLGLLGPAGSTVEQGGELVLDRTVVEGLKQRILTGQPIDPPYLDYDPYMMQVVDHEGRHRAQAAIEAGVEKFPVVVYLYDPHSWHDKVDRFGRVYDQTHYVRRLELDDERLREIADELGEEWTYDAHQPTAHTIHSVQRRPVQVHRYRRRR